jgi:hypothetical protein
VAAAESDVPGPPLRLARAVLVAGVVIHAVFVASYFTHWLDPLFVEARDSYGQAGDYFGIYQAGDNLLHGISIYDSRDYGDQAVRRVPYFYFYRYLPPTAYLAAIDALLLKPWTSYGLWVFCNELLLLLLLGSLLREPAGSRSTRLILAGLSLGFTPFYLEQWMGQFSFLMGVLLWLTFRAEMRGQAGSPSNPRGRRRLADTGRSTGSGDRHRVGDAEPPSESNSRRRFGDAGFWGWTGAITLKSFPALFAFPYLRQGRYRRVAGAAIVVLLVSAPYYAFHPHDLLHFAALNLRPLPPEMEKSRYGMTAVAQLLGYHLLGARADHLLDLGIRQIRLAALPVYGWIALVGTVTLAVTWRTARRAPGALLLCLWTLAFFLFFKDIWEYHHVMLLPVIYVLALTGPPRWPLLLGLVLALPTPYVLYASGWGASRVETWPLALALLHYGSMTLPTLLLYLWTLRKCLRAGRTPEGNLAVLRTPARPL